MPHIPFKILTRARERHPTHYVQPELKACKFLFPDDRPPMYSVPTASEYEAVHRLVEAESGRPPAMPAGNYFVPLVDAVLDLGDAFLWALSHDEQLNDQLIERARHGWTSGNALEVYKLLHREFTAIQETVNLCCRILTLVRDIRSDPHEETLQRYPLVDYAKDTVVSAMTWCRSTLVELGIPDAITGRLTCVPHSLTFNINFDLTPEWYGLQEFPSKEDERWPSQQASLFIAQRDARLRGYFRQMAALKARASREDAIRARIDAMLSEGADEYARRTGQPAPTGASGLEKFRAATRGGRVLH